VRESNKAAISLYDKFGFQVVGRRRNYYENPREDALLMTYTY
jgi:ribosomal-protein-alanine N-acetyltransferase